MFSQFVRNAFLPAAAIAAFCSLPAHAVTPVTQCGQALNVPGETYVLTANLHCPNGAGAFIQADKVKFDLQGHTLSGVSPAGGIISAAGPSCFAAKGVEITNGEIQGFGTAVGICVPGSGSTSTKWEIHDLVIRGVGSGIRILNANGNSIYNNEIERATLAGPLFGYGIELSNSSDNRLRNNTIRAARIAGIGIRFNSSDNDIRANIVSQSDFGIRAFPGTQENSIRSNKSSSNTSMDLQDDNAACGTNDWVRNLFNTSNQPCVK